MGKRNPDEITKVIAEPKKEKERIWGVLLVYDFSS
jgi:hypothetical protein